MRCIHLTSRHISPVYQYKMEIILLTIIKNDTVTKLSGGDHKCRVARLGQVTINILDTATLRFPRRCQGG